LETGIRYEKVAKEVIKDKDIDVKKHLGRIDWSAKGNERNKVNFKQGAVPFGKKSLMTKHGFAY
jgi:desulfoferrodoxin (superoxide reductase-like protein)